MIKNNPKKQKKSFALLACSLEMNSKTIENLKLYGLMILKKKNSTHGLDPHNSIKPWGHGPICNHAFQK